MDPRQERDVVVQVRQFLSQIALELEASAAGAKAAADSIDDRDVAWRHVQQLYARLQEATHLVSRLQTTVNDAVEANAATNTRPEAAK